MSIILVPEDVIRSHVQAPGDVVSEDYSGCTLDGICLITGASMFCEDHVTPPFHDASPGVLVLMLFTSVKERN